MIAYNLIFPLRKEINIAFQGLPRDLTMAEVKRIVALLEIMVSSDL